MKRLAYNRRMTRPATLTGQLLVPAALLPPEQVTVLLADMQLPHLSRLARQASAGEHLTTRDDLEPWQSWLLGHDPAANLAELWANGLPVPPSLQATTAGLWLAEPVHFDIGRNHLVLAETTPLEITADEGSQLAAAIIPTLAECGWHLHIAEPAHWFLTRTDRAPCDLHGAARERAIGRNVAPWMPTDQGSGAALAWRRASNEIQMIWFTHPCNAQSEVRGMPTLNALWLSGNGGSGTLQLPDTPLARARRTRIESSLALLATLATQRSDIDGAPTHHLCSFDALIESAMREDWGAWRHGLQDLDQRVGGLIAALRLGKYHSLEVILCGEQGLRIFNLRARDLWKFWGRGNLNRMFCDALSTTQT